MDYARARAPNEEPMFLWWSSAPCS